MYKLAFLLLTVIATVSSEYTPVNKCKNVVEELYKTVKVSTPRGLCTKQPCELVSGENVNAEIAFQVRHQVDQITLKCNATALGVTIEYPIPDAERGCDLLINTICPIEPDTEAELLLSMNVLKIFPKVAVDLVFYLEDQNRKMISCFEIPTKVVD